MNERTIAAALRDVGEEVLLSTKVAPSPEGTGFEPERIRDACAKSLERLGVDRVEWNVGSGNASSRRGGSSGRR